MTTEQKLKNLREKVRGLNEDVKAQQGTIRILAKWLDSVGTENEELRLMLSKEGGGVQ